MSVKYEFHPPKCNFFLPIGCTTATEILHDPALDPEHRNRDSYIAAVKTRVAEWDEIIAGWYRHRGECRIGGCDCGERLAAAMSVLSAHLARIKHAFGEAVIDDYPHFGCLVIETFGPPSYEALSSRRVQ